MASLFPAGVHNAATSRHNSITDKHETQITKGIQTSSTALERSVRKIMEGLNMSDSTNITIIYDVDQNKQMFGSHDKSIDIKTPSTPKSKYKKEIKQR